MANKRARKAKQLIGQQPAAQLPVDYPELLNDLKARIRNAQVKAALAVNRELLLLYWDIGRNILSRQEAEGWGAKVIDRLAADLRKAFPQMTGLSPRNLNYMRAFAETWPDRDIVQQVVAQIPWGQNIALLDKLKDPAQRLWYARQTYKHGWSRAVLVHQIDSDLFVRQGSASNNFDATLPAPQSDLAEQVIKDPYVFEFLGDLAIGITERQLERKLIERIRDFLLELGKGFAFVASQHHLEVDHQDFYLDLLFYHLHLRCYVVIDLKVEPFKPEFAGKMGFYVNAVDDLIRDPRYDQPTIGIVLCKERSRVIVEYTLRESTQPIGVSTYRLLPEQLKGEIPSPEALENELRNAEDTEK
ncbi:MAG: PDDEXK nuclease domain-containing protein [Opitutales bacterium]